MSNEAHALVDLIQWSEGGPIWQRDALRRLLERDQLSETDLNELVEICKNEGEGAIETLSSLLTVPDSSTNVVNLRSINGVTNINALSTGQKLTFTESGLTVIYGANGSGKSGYARILKSACRARLPAKGHEVLPNIYISDSLRQKATIDFSYNGTRMSYDWEPNTPPESHLLLVSVFDNRTAKVHVDKANEVAYTPYPMLILERLAKVVNIVKERISTEIKVLEQQTPTSISNPTCHEDSRVSNLLSRLNNSTAYQEVNELSELTEQDKVRYEQLKTHPNLSTENLVLSKESLIQKLSSLNKKFENLHAAVCDEVLHHLASLYQTYTTSREAATVVADTLFIDEPLPDVGTEVWCILWEAARRYSEDHAYKDSSFPWTDEDARCVLCQQELDDEATKRFIRFESFITDETKRKERYALESFNAAFSSLSDVAVSLADIRETVNLVRNQLDDDELAERVRRAALLMKLRLRFTHRADVSIDKLNALPKLEPWPSDDFLVHITALSDQVRKLRTSEESDEKENLRREFEDLSDRYWLAVNREVVIEEIDRLKKICSLKKRLKDTTTNRISVKSKSVAERLVTQTLTTRFKTEIGKLGGTDLNIELQTEKTQQGVSYFKIALSRSPNSTVGEVLSEGEQHSVAIAAFLAELSTTDSRAAIVLDDPVSSLDHVHRTAVAERLVEEGFNRQVIVFTHDLPFLHLLDRTARSNQVSITFRHVTRSGVFAGFVQRDPPVHVQPIEMAISGMQKQIDNQEIHYDLGDMEKWEQTVDTVVKRLRLTWERAVEDVLAPVFKRMSEKVRTNGLEKVAVITKDDCDTMRQSYERASKFLHSAPDALDTPLPEPAEVRKEIETLKRWVKEIGERQSKIK